MVSWARRRFRSEKSGRLPFDHITGVVLQHSSGEQNSNLRIALDTTAGELPITIAYGGNNRHLEDVAKAIRAVPGSGGILADDSPRSALAAGRIIDAVAFARSTRGLGLTEAKALVDERAAGSRPPKS